MGHCAILAGGAYQNSSMIVRISTIFCLVLALVAASDVSNETDDDDDGITTAAIDIDQDDIAEDDIAEDDIAEDDIAEDDSKFEISFEVNRLMHDDSDESDDDNEDDDDGEDNDDNVDEDGEDEDADPDWDELWNYDKENDRIIRVHNLKDANLKAGTGYNPLPEEIIYPFIDKRTIITKQINDTIIDYGRYHKFKWDMETQAFA